jgi:ribosomal protein S28E/S33
MKCLRPAVLVGLLILFCVGISSAPKQTAGENPKDKESKFIKPELIQGCYQLGTLNWRPDLKLGEDEVFITPPQRIQILTERGINAIEKNGYLVRPAPGIPPSIHRASYWVPAGPNAIEVIFTTGTSGLSMQLKVEGEILKGKAKTHWDFLRRHQTAQVIARKIDCGKG